MLRTIRNRLSSRDGRDQQGQGDKDYVVNASPDIYRAPSSDIVMSDATLPPSLMRSKSEGGGTGASRYMATALSKAKHANSLRSAGSKIIAVEEPTPLTSADNTLFKFDNCIDAADALTASSGHESSILPSQRFDNKTGLSDCGVLVSPEGDLLLIPGDPVQLFHPPICSGHGTDATVKQSENSVIENGGANNKTSSLVSSRNSTLFSELMLHSKDDYASSVFVGMDLTADTYLNRFNSKGWSLTATSMSVRQTEIALNETIAFLTQMASQRTATAASAVAVVESLQKNLMQLQNTVAIMPYGRLVDPQRSENCFKHMSTPVHSRVGPLVSETSSAHQAWQGLTEYYLNTAQQEIQLWSHSMSGSSALSSNNSSDSLERQHVTGRSNNSNVITNKASTDLITNLKRAAFSLKDRGHHRQYAIEQAACRVEQMEQRMNYLKNVAARKWDAVFHAEDLVTQKVEAAMEERSRAREKHRLEQLLIADESTGTTSLGATSEEIWSIVSTVAESMVDGSFEPIDNPEEPLSFPRDRSGNYQDIDGASSSPNAATICASPETIGEPSKTKSTVTAPSKEVDQLPSTPMLSREMVELDMGLPQLRAEAMAADEAVADGADSFMNLLTTLDTTRRSSRVAADTALLSAGNTYASSIHSLIQSERQFLEQRLKDLEAVEELANKMDVRADLNRYIALDKLNRGGMSHLGDDDDGGMASALAILSRHVDGSMGSISVHHMMVDQSNTEGGNGMKSDEITAAVDRIFQKGIAHLSYTESEDVVKEGQVFEESVNLLCADVSKPVSRSRRSKVCYLMNSKRSSQAEIPTLIQFNALCRLFSAILTGCGCEESGVSNAKMCIMLAQTFYVDEQTVTGMEENGNSSAREHRRYVKDSLKLHPIWENESFWDHTLSNQITESLTHSGVMSNFEKGHISNNSKERKKSEWTETRKLKWYDLNALERTEAASQVQAVVFAQLGALAHSMMELGLGLHRSCAFVRRMAIRHQLPSSQRAMLLQHLINRDDADKQKLGNSKSDID